MTGETIHTHRGVVDVLDVQFPSTDHQYEGRLVRSRTKNDDPLMTSKPREAPMVRPSCS